MLIPLRRSLVPALLLLVLFTPAVQSAEPFRFPEDEYEGAQLKYVNELPVLMVAGTPEEIGRQVAELGVKPADRLLAYPRESLERWGLGLAWPGILQIGKGMRKNFPPEQLREMESIAKAAGKGYDELIAGNTMFDIKKFFHCSTLLIEGSRSKTGGVLLGRNLDFPTLGYLNQYTLVTVYRPEGKRAFAAIGFPGAVGCLSGMNDAGLAIAVLESYGASDGSGKFDSEGTPYAMCYRRLLEECATVDEAVKLLREMHRTTRNNLALADKRGGVVLEITPANVAVREPENGICPCTNHFRTAELATATRCWRYERLSKIPADSKIGLEEMAKKLHEVNQGSLTLQTMVFEPETLKLHLAIGKCPTSALPMRTLELAPLFEQPKPVAVGEE